MAFRGRVLVVDDDQYIREILAYNVRRNGCEAVTAANGKEALDILEETSFAGIDLVLADIWMPQVSGLELLKAIIKKRPDLPVALISGQATLDSALDALNTGAFAYLLKPVNTDKIRDLIDRGLRKVEDARTRQKLERQVARLAELEQTLTTLQEQVVRPANGSGLAELIDGLHHELGNVTQAITLNLESLEAAANVPPELRENMEDLHASADDLLQLVNRLKEYPALTKRGDLCDVRAVISETVAELQTMMVTHNVRLHCVVPETVLSVMCEPESLQKAFRQVIQNAVEAVPDGGTVSVTAADANGHAIIAVEDNGPGFPSELLDKLFQPNTTTRVTDGFVRGLGLGLFIARATVELHGGSIRAANRPEGGAVVTIRLPLQQI